jgi:hypothetical protein
MFKIFLTTIENEIVTLTIELGQKIKQPPTCEQVSELKTVGCSYIIIGEKNETFRLLLTIKKLI